MYILGAKIDVFGNNIDITLRLNCDSYSQCYDEDRPVGGFSARSLAWYQSHQAERPPRHIAQEPQHQCSRVTLVE